MHLFGGLCNAHVNWNPVAGFLLHVSDFSIRLQLWIYDTCINHYRIVTIHFNVRFQEA